MVPCSQVCIKKFKFYCTIYISILYKCIVFRTIEQALLICKEMGDLSEVSKLAHSACSLFQQHGSPESGVTALDKAAKMLEATQPQQALELFKRAADIIMVSN